MSTQEEYERYLMKEYEQATYEEEYRRWIEEEKEEANGTE